MDPIGYSYFRLFEKPTKSGDQCVFLFSKHDYGILSLQQLCSWFLTTIRYDDLARHHLCVLLSCLYLLVCQGERNDQHSSFINHFSCVIFTGCTCFSRDTNYPCTRADYLVYWHPCAVQKTKRTSIRNRILLGGCPGLSKFYSIFWLKKSHQEQR